ncbi:glycosyltransferase family 4 protein [Streptomyces sp. NBC_01477]|uniref:glycosyltransferase family 4 protein n=1 Tax=Streptomyces sp. NBC_01477 TaxID=2976015 RepID=UPI002E2F1977|nr:glycosyltransferase family 1 protein [Streptomyces sp. NBC_01477]
MSTSRSGGVGNYARRVISGLAAREDFDVVALLPDFAYDRAELPESNAHFRVEVVPTDCPTPDGFYDRRVLWEQDVALRYLEKIDHDVFFGPVFMAPCGWRGPKVVTVHDLAFERHRGYNTAESTAYYSSWARKCAEQAAAVMCISHHTRADVLERWDVAAGVFVTHLAPCLAPGPVDQELSGRVVAQALGLAAPFGLYVGDAVPRKNLTRLVAAVSREECFGPGYPMVLTLPPSAELSAVLREYGAEDRVRPIGHCPEDLLPHLYAAADFLVYPSLFEGFGLPPLEAMACGTAVAATSSGAVPEVLQENALYFEPRDTDSIAAAIGRLAREPLLREELAERGRRHAARYTWERTVARTAEVLRNCGAGSLADRRPIAGRVRRG